MATIQTRTNRAGETSYRVQVRLKGHPPASASFRRLTDARKWAQTTEAAMLEGRHFDRAEAKRHTLAEAIDRYLASEERSAHTSRQLMWWRDKLGPYLLADIKPATIAEARDDLRKEETRGQGQKTAKKRGPATANRYLAALSAVLNTAVMEWQWLPDNPCHRVKNLNEPQGRTRYLSDDERNRLLDACRKSDNPDLYAAVLLALSTGARRGEIMGLTWRQVDLKRGQIALTKTKNKTTRALPLMGQALTVMRKRAKVRHLKSDLVFPSATNPAQPVDLTAAWRTALADAEISDFRWHDLRHTAASYLAMSGASLAEIAEVLGHKTLQMVKRYSHVSEAHTSSVVERMNAEYLAGER